MCGKPVVVATIFAAAVAAFGMTRVDAASVEHLTLRDIADRADRIVRGTVIAADESRIAAGGGLLPVVVYRIQVADVVKGTAGDVLEIRLLSPGKGATGRSRHASLFRDLPQFRVGQDYLLALTRPSAIGLSTTVGLGQGAFELRGAPGREQAVNQWNNLGLLNGPVTIAGAPAGRDAAAARAAGPLPYTQLVDAIRARLTR
jgi:hypothetical protein